MVGGEKDREEMRLIDADALYEKLQKDSTYDLDFMDSELREIIDNQPTAFDTEKVIEQLESEKRYGSKYDSYYEENLYRGEMFENDVNNKTIDKAIDIVKKGGVE